jgi:hypothetical protein
LVDREQPLFEGGDGTSSTRVGVKDAERILAGAMDR